jgi:hypothetical protein
MAEEILYRPRELFDTKLKEAYHKSATEYFDNLSKEANVNVEENALHVKEYKKRLEEQKKLEQQASSAKGLKVFVIVMMIILFAVGFIVMVAGLINASSAWYLIIVGLVLAGGGVALAVLLGTKISKEVKEKERLLEMAKKRSEEALRLCYADMAPLNSSFDWNAPCAIMEKATPIIDLDPTFTPERFCYLRDKFGFEEEKDPHTTVLGAISGNIQGNPFIMEKIMTERKGDKTYTGSITITWTTTYRDKNGVHTQTHSQVLTASIVRPAPFYRTDVRLIYGNEAAPHLHFSRTPKGADKLNEKERDKAAIKGMKKLRSLSEEQLKKGQKHVLTPMGNDHFDVFFGAEDRDNEVEFRLLYTPLAQKNILDLIENPSPYGDDFVMVKSGMVNSVASAHSQHFDYSANPARFMGYDWNEMKSSFVSYCDSYIQSLFFDLAPLLSVPLYQMHKPHEYIYGGFASNLTSFEHEIMANGMDASCFRPKKAADDLPLIIKEASSKKVGNADEVLLSAYSFIETPMVEYVTKMGGDGHTHSIPVHWIKYDKVSAETLIGVKGVGGTRKDYLKANAEKGLGYSKTYFERGLLAFLLGGAALTEEEDLRLSNLFLAKKTSDNKGAVSQKEE